MFLLQFVLNVVSQLLSDTHKYNLKTGNASEPYWIDQLDAYNKKKAFVSKTLLAILSYSYSIFPSNECLSTYWKHEKARTNFYAHNKLSLK